MTKKMMWGLWALAIVALALATACTAPAREEKPATTAPAAAAQKAAPTIPTNPLKEAYFGEQHLHTAYSLDAYIGGARLTPSDAYRFAKGEEVEVGGQKVRLHAPLDWAAVTDHAEYLGEMYSTMNDGRAGPRQRAAQGTAWPQTIDEREKWFLEYVVKNNRGETPQHPPFYAGPETAIGGWKDGAGGRRGALQAGHVHDDPGLRVERGAQGRQPAPQRLLPRTRTCRSGR